MTMIGISLSNVKAEVNQKNPPKGDINVNSTPTIENITKQDIESVGLKGVLSVAFEFRTVYTPKVGEIIMNGEILYQSKNANDVIAKWKKERKVEENLAIELLNIIFRKCLTQAILLAHELRLPPPIMFPTVGKKPEGE